MLRLLYLLSSSIYNYTNVDYTHKNLVYIIARPSMCFWKSKWTRLSRDIIPMNKEIDRRDFLVC